MKKISKHFKLPDGLVNQVRNLSHSMSIIETEFVTRAIQYLIKNEGADYIGLYEAINQMLENHQKKIDEELKRIRLGVNQISKESQMQMEFWNNQYLAKGTGNLLTSDVKKANEVSLAEANIQNRILKMQQKKYS